MLFTVEFMLMFSLSTIHLARAQECPNMCTCSGTAVDCSNKGLTQIPDDISSTTTTLYLFGNSITSIEENGFKGLTSLQELYLSGNGITSIEPNVFEGLTSLQFLFIESFPIDKPDVHNFRQLNGNSITSIEENGFEGLISLQELDLSGNSITSIAQNAFEGLTSLQNVYFNNNPLVCCSVTGFVDWVNRRSLDVFGTCTAHNKTTAILNFNTSDCIVPVDGGWSDWENSTCSVTCGDGTVTMFRECNTPVPSGGGNNCSGEPIDTDSCNLGVCPESCNTLEKELDKKSGKRSDNKSGKWSDNKSGKWSVNKSGKKRNGKNGKKEKRQNKKGNKPNRNGWY